MIRACWFCCFPFKPAFCLGAPAKQRETHAHAHTSQCVFALRKLVQAIDEGELVRIDGLQNKQAFWEKQIKQAVHELKDGFMNHVNSQPSQPTSRCVLILPDTVR